jgi:insulysin
MLDSSSERELNAVHSEHSKNLQNDLWRKYQLTKHISKENHPYHKFSTGDKNSLANPNLREMLFNFYNSNYSSNIMKLVVYGQDDIDRLSKFVEEQFNEVKDHQFGKFKILEHPFGEKALGKLIKLVPVKDKRVLELTWFLPDQSPSYKYSPSKYVSHILGHEGKGSLLSFLISQGLATALSAGGSDSYECYS